MECGEAEPLPADAGTAAREGGAGAHRKEHRFSQHRNSRPAVLRQRAAHQAGRCLPPRDRPAHRPRQYHAPRRNGCAPAEGSELELHPHLALSADRPNCSSGRPRWACMSRSRRRSAGWAASLDSPTNLFAILTPTSAMVDYHHSHPSVIVWSLANESHFNLQFLASARMCKELDPTRPTTFNHDFANEPFGARQSPTSPTCIIRRCLTKAS